MAATPAKATPVIDTEPTNTPDEFSYKHATFEEVLEDLSSRFILNLPEDELAEVERVCFQVEQAHWYYEDFIREENPSFPSLPLKKFSEILFRSCPLLHHWSHDHETAFNGFMNYKTRVPVCGAIMLNEALTKCLLVKGWKSSAGWGFPKGKVNENEDEALCAVREVLEETGYNLSGQIRRKDCIQLCVKQQPITLFVVAGVPEDFTFKTQTRKEISKIDWFKLADLPTWKKSRSATSKFYLITPVVGPLKSIVRNLRKTRKAEKPPSLQIVETLSSPDGEGELEAKDSQVTFESPETVERSSQSQSCEAEISSSQSSSIDPHTPSVNGDIDSHPGLGDKPVFKQNYPEVVDTGTSVGVPVDVALSSFNTDPRTHWSRLMTRLNHSQESSAQTTPQALTPTPPVSMTPPPRESQPPDGPPSPTTRASKDSSLRCSGETTAPSSIYSSSNCAGSVAPRGLPMPAAPPPGQGTLSSPEQLIKRTRQLQLLESVVAEDMARRSASEYRPPMSAHILGAYSRPSSVLVPDQVRIPLRSASVNPGMSRGDFPPYHHQHNHSLSAMPPPPLLRPSYQQSPLNRLQPSAGSPLGGLSPSDQHLLVDSAHKGQMLSILSGGNRGPMKSGRLPKETLSILLQRG